MNKKIFIPIILIIVIIAILVIVFIPKKENKEISNNTINVIENTNINSEVDEIEGNNIFNNDVNQNKVENTKPVYIKVNNQILNIELEDNSATRELKERLKNEDIIIEAHEYGGFEKVGNLGFSLPREDKSITTSAGDIVLYQGNQISLFYNSNSWSYTKLGRIIDIDNDELKNILGNGDVTITITLSR